MSLLNLPASSRIGALLTAFYLPIAIAVWTSNLRTSIQLVVGILLVGSWIRNLRYHAWRVHRQAIVAYDLQGPVLLRRDGHWISAQRHRWTWLGGMLAYLWVKEQGHTYAVLIDGHTLPSGAWAQLHKAFLKQAPAPGSE